MFIKNFRQYGEGATTISSIDTDTGKPLEAFLVELIRGESGFDEELEYITETVLENNPELDEGEYKKELLDNLNNAFKVPIKEFLDSDVIKDYKIRVMAVRKILEDYEPKKGKFEDFEQPITLENVLDGDFKVDLLLSKGEFSEQVLDVSKVRDPARWEFINNPEKATLWDYDKYIKTFEEVNNGDASPSEFDSLRKYEKIKPEEISVLYSLKFPGVLGDAPEDYEVESGKSEFGIPKTKEQIETIRAYLKEAKEFLEEIENSDEDKDGEKPETIEDLLPDDSFHDDDYIYTEYKDEKPVEESIKQIIQFKVDEIDKVFDYLDEFEAYLTSDILDRTKELQLSRFITNYVGKERNTTLTKLFNKLKKDNPELFSKVGEKRKLLMFLSGEISEGRIKNIQIEERGNKVYLSAISGTKEYEIEIMYYYGRLERRKASLDKIEIIQRGKNVKTTNEMLDNNIKFIQKFLPESSSKPVEKGSSNPLNE